MTFTRVEGVSGHLFESPRWVDQSNVFQWVDILGSRVFRWDPLKPEPPRSRVLDLEFVTVALPLDGDRSIVASRNSLHLFSWGTGELGLLGEWEFPEAVRFNDGSISPAGSIYIGSMSMSRRPDEALLYRFDATTRDLTPVLSHIGISNGLAWLTDTQALYVDSLTSQIDLLTFGDDDTVRREVWHAFQGQAEPDGLAVDADGIVHVAMWGDGLIRRFDRHANEMAAWAVAEKLTTSIAFNENSSPAMALITTAGDEEPSREGEPRGTAYTRRLDRR
jgi:sugar lactone lactonase YvrE